MAISNIPMPSIALVLTSGRRFHRRHPDTIIFDTCSLPPSAPDRLMKTIGLRDEPEDDKHAHYTDISTPSFSQEDVGLPVVFEEAESSSSDSIAKEAGHSFKFVFKRTSALVKKFSYSA